MQSIAAKIRLLVNAANKPTNDALLHAAYARLSFHDCTGPGGCDGCINLRLGENNGLGAPIALLEGFYNGTFMKLTRDNISRSDLWQLASLVSLHYGVLIDGPSSYIPTPLALENFKWGRKDCPTSPDAPSETASDFPGGTAGHNATVGFFKERFGLSPKQTLALMGVHSLGNAKRRNSGFAGAWSHKRESLSNRFYNHLTDFTWTQMRINTNTTSGPRVQWTHPGFLTGVCMLNSDVALLRELTPDKDGVQAGDCFGRHSRCPPAPTFADFNRYARNNTRWIDDFAQAYNIMANNCGRNLVTGTIFQCRTNTVNKPSKRAGLRESAQRFAASEVVSRSVSMPWRTVATM